jgi:hypothetical protein
MKLLNLSLLISLVKGSDSVVETVISPEGYIIMLKRSEDFGPELRTQEISKGVPESLPSYFYGWPYRELATE